MSRVEQLVAEALAELAREAARARRVRGRRSVGMERHADDEGVGPPLGDQRGDRGGTRLALLGDRRQRCRRPGQRVSGRDADAPRAEVESEIGAGGAGRRSAHACPASELSMPASMPSSESALS